MKHGPNARRQFWLAGLFAAYALAASACLQLRPLWLDEVIQLIASTAPTAGDFMRGMGSPNPGAAPLGYLTQRPFVLVGGATALWARVPSVLFSILACWVLLEICRQSKIAPITITVGLFMIIPLQFRYAIEARPYSEALFFSLLATLAFLKLEAGPTARWACLSILATIAALYTQPYAILSICGAVFWTTVTSARERNWKRAAIGPACVLISLLAFLPWYIVQTPKWAAGIQEHGIPHFHWTFGLIEDLFKGISGDGFACSTALLFLCAAAFFARTSGLGVLLSTLLFSVCGALAGDAFMNYFFASRQIIFALPGLAILAAVGFSALYRRNKIVALAALAILLVASVEKNVTMQIDSQEDWRAAAATLTEIARSGRCIEVVPANSFALYGFFDPGLASKICPAAPEFGAALVSHLYTTAEELRSAESSWKARGFVARRSTAVGGTTITLEERR